MPGPRPTPVALRVLRGNPSHRRLPREPAFERAPECPDPPSFLDSLAVDEWWRVAPGLFALNMLTTVDVMPFASYCCAYARWANAEAVLRRMSESDELTKGMIIKGADGTPRTNPLVRISADAASDMLRYASEFGFTGAARARIAGGVGQPPTPSKFDGLLK